MMNKNNTIMMNEHTQYRIDKKQPYYAINGYNVITCDKQILQ